MNCFIILVSILVFLYATMVCFVIGDGVVFGLDLDFSWVGGVSSCFIILFDWSSLVFSMTVLTISSFVMMFSCFYMSHEKFSSRFSWLVMLFVLYMNFLIFTPSLMWMMVGWDGLGVVSFLLVIYYSNSDSLSAGMITALVNRVGDAMFILLISSTVGLLSWHCFDLWVELGILISSLLMVGSMTKSAQVPFSAWLPAAMAAPTPVSALVHSSTLVTAGVYVLFRFSDSFSGVWYFLLSVFSMMTLIFAGMTASLEVDLKKVVAFSTLSQLGVMMLSLSFNMKNICFFHLITHAFFKALMFLCVGAVIFMSGGVQDSRLFSGLWFKMPIVCSWLVVCCFSLVGIPFMAGFYSKDLVIEGCVFSEIGVVGLFLLYFSVVLTSLYSFLLLLKITSRSSFSSMEGFSDVNIFLLISLFGLGWGALFSGVILQKILIKLNYFVYVSCFYKVMTLFSVVVGSIFSVLFYFVSGSGFMRKLSSNQVFLVEFFKSLMAHFKWLVGKMWFLPHLSGNFMSSSSLWMFLWLNKSLEKGLIESFLWKDSYEKFLKSSKNLFSFIQGGRVISSFLLLVLIFFIFSIVVLLLSFSL